jgi:hypothetical protein
MSHEAASVLYDLLEQSGLHAPWRLKALGFSSDFVDVGTTVDVIAVVDCNFKPLRIQCPRTRSPNFVVRDILVYGKSQFAGHAHPIEIDGDNFIPWPMDVCPKGEVIIIRVENVTGYS